MITQANRIPSLDGLRAFSISLVLFGHVAGTHNAYPFRPYTLDVARLGVQIFYIISGFLISFLLLREHQGTGRISLKMFYRRRMLRILPVFCSYIAAVTILSWIGVLHVGAHDLLTASTFTANISQVTDWNVAHFWSLSTEEQFYLIWPPSLVLLGMKKSIKLAAMVMILAPLVSRLLWQHEYLSWPLLLQSVNAIAAGCVLAGLRPRLHLSHHYMQFLRSSWSLPLGPIAFAFDLWHGRGGTLLFEIATLFGMVFIDRLITVRDLAARLINFPPIVFLGSISYSLYVWQQMFLNRSGNAVFNSFPFNLVLAFTFALGSFFWIERPFLRFTKRLNSDAHEASELDKRPSLGDRTARAY